MSERGSTLLETTAALGIAGLIVYGSAQTALQATQTLSAVEVRERMLSVARNQIETARGAPCAPPFVCPPAFRCSLLRRDIGTTVELRAEVGHGAGGSRSDDKPVVLATFIRAPDGCG